MRPEPRDAVRVVGAVAHLVRPPLEPAGERGVDRRVDAVADERLGRLPRRRRARRVPRGTSGLNVSSGKTTIVSSLWTTASFSIAISSTVSPSTSVCSSPTFVSRTTRERTTLVASWRPPSPASTTATSTSASANAAKAAAVIVSNWVAPTLLGRRANARERRRQVGRVAVDPDPLAPRPHVRRERRPDREPFARAAAARS